MSSRNLSSTTKDLDHTVGPLIVVQEWHTWILNEQYKGWILSIKSRNTIKYVLILYLSTLVCMLYFMYSDTTSAPSKFTVLQFSYSTNVLFVIKPLLPCNNPPNGPNGLLNPRSTHIQLLWSAALCQLEVCGPWSSNTGWAWNSSTGLGQEFLKTLMRKNPWHQFQSIFLIPIKWLYKDSWKLSQ